MMDFWQKLLADFDAVRKAQYRDDIEAAAARMASVESTMRDMLIRLGASQQYRPGNFGAPPRPQIGDNTAVAPRPSRPLKP